MTVQRALMQPAGIKSFRRFLQAELPSLRQSPVLVIASDPADSSQPSISNVSDSCRLVQFTLAQQMGLRTVPSTVSSAYPTLQDLEEKQELIRRTGAASVVAVGSGAAMDLAKAMPNDIENLILVPSTYAALLASNASHSLFLDAEEETLVPLPRDTETDGKNDSSPKNTTVAPLDSKYIAPVDSSHVLYACLALILDASYRKSDHPLLPTLVQKVHALLDSPNEELSEETSMELLLECGKLISYGLGSEDRSIPMTLAASLIPQIFPHAHVLTFWASLVPGLCEICRDDPNGLVERVQAGGSSAIPQLAVKDETLDGFSVPDMALSHIQQNQTVWKSFDVPNNVLTEVLSKSLKR